MPSDRVAPEEASRVERVKRYGKSFLISLLDRIPFKEKSPFTTALLRHYVEASGDPVSLANIPTAWQDFIVKKTHAKPGRYKDVSGYDVGLYDLQNSLGHFDVDVTPMGGRENLYAITDTYAFGFKRGDHLARHGFPLQNLSDTSINLLRKILPDDIYWNPGGFQEKWEIRRGKKETILFIPQQFLAENGASFDVRGSFRR
jgi:hypothetical protein